MTDRPTLSQTQIIRSLADAITWLEREVSWGVKPASLQKLTGRIGELYVAMMTNGQMAIGATEPGYDVISAEGDHISVKTITSSNHVDFKLATFHHAHRVVILRVDDDEEKGVVIEQLMDLPREEARKQLREIDGYLRYTVRRPKASTETLANTGLKVTARASYGEDDLIRYETGAIRIQRNGAERHINVKGFLRPIAVKLGISTDNEVGSPLNTQQLGARVIQALKDIKG